MVVAHRGVQDGLPHLVPRVDIRLLVQQQQKHGHIAATGRPNQRRLIVVVSRVDIRAALGKQMLRPLHIPPMRRPKQLGVRIVRAGCRRILPALRQRRRSRQHGESQRRRSEQADDRPPRQGGGNGGHGHNSFPFTRISSIANDDGQGQFYNKIGGIAHFFVVPKLCLGMRLAKLCLANLIRGGEFGIGSLIRVRSRASRGGIPKQSLGTTQRHRESRGAKRRFAGRILSRSGVEPPTGSRSEVQPPTGKLHPRQISARNPKSGKASPRSESFN